MFLYTNAASTLEEELAALSFSSCPRSSADTVQRSQGAQNTLGERQPTKLRVVGSNPTGGTNSVRIQESTLISPTKQLELVAGPSLGLAPETVFYTHRDFGSSVRRKQGRNDVPQLLPRNSKDRFLRTKSNSTVQVPANAEDDCRKNRGAFFGGREEASERTGCVTYHGSLKL